ncbi:MAG: archaellin/type IV pilin N-terminal domain-containing protein, partial [Candidatus Syntropharchaeia archaeon]
KGITPIIAIIILLMITIGLAALAWTYLSGFLTGYTKTLALVDFYCTGTTTANVILRNSGVEPLALGSGCNIPDTQNTVTCGSLTITRTDTDAGGNPNNFNGASINPNSGTLAPGATLTFTDTCTTAGTPAVCTYRFVTGGTGATVVSVPCG